MKKLCAYVDANGRFLTDYINSWTRPIRLYAVFKGDRIGAMQLVGYRRAIFSTASTNGPHFWAGVVGKDIHIIGPRNAGRRAAFTTREELSKAAWGTTPVQYGLESWVDTAAAPIVTPEGQALINLSAHGTFYINDLTLAYDRTGEGPADYRGTLSPERAAALKKILISILTPRQARAYADLCATAEELRGGEAVDAEEQVRVFNEVNAVLGEKEHPTPEQETAAMEKIQAMRSDVAIERSLATLNPRPLDDLSKSFNLKRLGTENKWSKVLTKKDEPAIFRKLIGLPNGYLRTTKYESLVDAALEEAKNSFSSYTIVWDDGEELQRELIKAVRGFGYSAVADTTFEGTDAFGVVISKHKLPRLNDDNFAEVTEQGTAAGIPAELVFWDWKDHSDQIDAIERTAEFLGLLIQKWQGGIKLSKDINSAFSSTDIDNPEDFSSLIQMAKKHLDKKQK